MKEQNIQVFETKNRSAIALILIVFYLGFNLILFSGPIVNEAKESDVFHINNAFLQAKVYVIIILTFFISL